MKIKLEEGKTYFNCYNRKTFDVITINNGIISFQYVGSDVCEGDLKQKEDLIKKTLIDKMDGFERNLHALKAAHEEKIENKKDKFRKTQEEKALILTQHLVADVDFSDKYYRTLGFLARTAKIIARIPVDTKEWFDDRYCMVKGEYPEKGQSGYILHDENTNKWYSQVQILFYLPTGKMSTDVVLDPGNVLVKGDSYDELKPYNKDYSAYSKTTKFIVNGNELCWELLQLGFNLGNIHNIEKIRSNVPSEYVKCFDEGI